MAEQQQQTEAAAPATPDIAGQLPDFADWLPASVKPYWDILNAYPVIGALAIALIFFVIAYFVRGVILRSVQRLTRNTATEVDDAVFGLISRPVFNTVFLFGLSLAARAAGMPEGVTRFTVNALLSIIVVNWIGAGLPLSSLVTRTLGALRDRFAIIEERTIPLFDLVGKLMVLLFGSYALLMIWGINPVGWLASAGIVGIAVGFAAKDTLANLFSGFFILADSPYKIGDYVNLDSGERGKVTHLGMRSTRLLTRDDIEITVPNAVIANAKIVNESGGPWMKVRSRIKIGVAYGSDVDEVCAVLQAVGETHPGVCSAPAPRVRMRAFGESSLDFELLCWIENPEDRGRISHELYMEVYKALAVAEIGIPFPQRDLHIKQWVERG